MNKSLLTGCLLAAIALTGCEALPGAVGLLSGASTVSGKVFAPADQVAVIAAGGANYRTVLARADEKGVARARVTLTKLGESAAAATAQTDTGGGFTVEVPAGTYTVSATFTGKNEQNVTLSGLVVADAGLENFELDVAHHLVAAKLLSGSLTAVDEGALTAAVAKLDQDLSSVAKAPTPTDRASAAAAFDAHASAGTKAAVEALKQ